MPANKYLIGDFASAPMLQTLSRHRCTGCGDCCRWPGQVFLYPDDIKSISAQLKIPVREFLLTRCVVLRWEWQGYPQFRIALARKADYTGCVFLRGTQCGIHEFKPLMCKAGPAGWPWIREPKFFWYYVASSPSFQNEPGTLSLAEANEFFVATRSAEAAASQAASLEALSRICEVPEEALQALKIIDFKREV
jgi:uncharacterized protein